MTSSTEPVPFEKARFYSAFDDGRSQLHDTPQAALEEILELRCDEESLQALVRANAPIAIYPYNPAPPPTNEQLWADAGRVLDSFEETWGRQYAAEDESLWPLGALYRTVATDILRTALRAVYEWADVTAFWPGEPRRYSAEEVLAMLPAVWLEEERDDLPHGQPAGEPAE